MVAVRKEANRSEKAVVLSSLSPGKAYTASVRSSTL